MAEKKNKNEKKRCPWVKLTNKEYVAYHDKEWGRPVRRDHKHFEMITLEGAQAGLSWETVLNKREEYRRVFLNFDPVKVQKFSQSKVEKILTNPGVIRNRLKIESTITNAKAFIDIQKEFGTFNKYIWGFTEGKVIYLRPRTVKQYNAKTKLSDEISKDLKKRGFKFVGSTIIYAYLQATGIVNEHSADCYLSKP